MIQPTEVEAEERAVTVTADDGVDLGGEVQELSPPSSGKASLGLKCRGFFCIHDLVFFFLNQKANFIYE